MYLTKKSMKGEIHILNVFSELKINVSIICHVWKDLHKILIFSIIFLIFEHACFHVCGFSGCISDAKHTWRAEGEERRSADVPCCAIIQL